MMTADASTEYPNPLALTFDVDWAPDALMLPIVEQLREARIKTTFFATHASPLLQSLEEELFEIALHPTWKDLTDLEAPIRSLLEAYPRAVGVRSHRLFFLSPLVGTFIRCGLLYESNYNLFLQDYIRPFRRVKDLVSLPFYWMDDAHFWMTQDFRLDLTTLDRPGVKVFAFHPHHVFCNTPSAEYYEATVRPVYSDPVALAAAAHQGEGTRTFFTSLVEHIASRRIPTFTMRELAGV